MKQKFDLIIAADTIVTMNDKIFEKPKSIQDAIETLKGLGIVNSLTNLR